jgi:hypothetical protein
MLAAAGLGTASRADDAPAEKSPPVAFVGDTPIDGAAIERVIRRLHPVSKPSGEQRKQIEVTVLEQLVDEALLRAELAGRPAGGIYGRVGPRRAGDPRSDQARACPR